MMTRNGQHPHLEVNPKTILPRISNILADKKLSPGEKNLLIDVTLRAGARGVIWHGNRALADDIGSSERQMTRYLAKLKEKNRVLEVPREPFRYLCPWPELKAKLARETGTSDVTRVAGQKCPSKVVISDQQSGPQKDANASEFQAVEAARQHSKRKSENKRKKKTYTEAKQLAVRDKLDRLESSWLREADRKSFLKHLDNLTEKKIGVPTLWEEWEKTGGHDAFVKKSGEPASRQYFLVMLKQRCAQLGFHEEC